MVVFLFVAVLLLRGGWTEVVAAQKDGKRIRGFASLALLRASVAMTDLFADSP